MLTPGTNPRNWLVKFAPFRTNWAEILRRGTFTLRGVRSPEACNYLAAMRMGDCVLFYHSQQERAIVGLMTVTREAYPDPTSNDPRWRTCSFAPIRTLPRPVPLAELKIDPRFAKLSLVCRPRLAVMPVNEEGFQAILSLSGS